MSNYKHPEYNAPSFTEEDAVADPFELFDRWFHDTMAAAPDYWQVTNAVTLGTATLSGRPSARIVLLQEYSKDGFIFFTNYESRKGEILAENPVASMLYYDPALSRQIEVIGTIEKTSDEISDNYFNLRPKRNKVAAWASPQSKAITREALDKAFDEGEEKYTGDDIPRPGYWGGYVLKPTEFEFWQGRPSRLHDRIRYLLDDKGSWYTERLAP
jgi:pyridoxamine 5'-phosphate oxidase